MDKVEEELNLKFVGQCSHQFQKDDTPYGVTMVYFKLLSESHLSIHTFVDEGQITLDLFTCDVSLEEKNIKKVLCDFCSVSFLCIDVYCFTRG